MFKIIKRRAERYYTNIFPWRLYDLILRLLDKQIDAKIIDLGCGGGVWHKSIMEKGMREIYGIDVHLQSAVDANKRGSYVILANLDYPFPLQDESFDVVISNQVIEHLMNVDNFISEIKRILKPDGYCIISTENLSSFDNLIALLLGQQAFSQHISKYYSVGNVFSPHFSYEATKYDYPHRTIFTYFGLLQLLKAYGFKIEKVLVANAFPIPNVLAKLDPVHSRFITIKARKNLVPKSWRKFG